MGSIKVLKNPRTISVVVEGNDHDYVKDHVPDFSKWLREQEKQYKEGLEMEKKVIAPNERLGAIQIRNDNSYLYNITNKSFPQWFQNNDWEIRQKFFDSLTEDQQHEIMGLLTRNTEIWKNMIATKRAMMKKMRFR